MKKILISRTFAVISPDSAEVGEYFDHGFLAEREEVTFRELVDYMREHPSPSCYPWRRDDRNASFSTDFEICSYGRGWYRETSIHFHRDNTDTDYKYWVWAREIAHANS